MIAARTLTPGIVHSKQLDQFVKGRRLGSWSRGGLKLLIDPRDLGIDCAIDVADRRLQCIILSKVQLQQEPVVIRQPSMQSIMKFLRRCLDALARQCRELVRIANAGNHRLDDATPARPHDVADHLVQPDVGLDQRLMHPLHVPGLLASQLLAATHQRAQLLERLFRNKTAVDQAAGHEIGKPHRIV